MKIAYVLCPDFTALDLIGPYDVISRWPDAEVRSLARSLAPASICSSERPGASR